MIKLRKLIVSFACITLLVAVSGCSNLIEDLKPKVINVKQFSASELGLSSITKATSNETLIVDPTLKKGSVPEEDDIVFLKDWGYGTTTIVCYGDGEGSEKEKTTVKVTVKKNGTVKYHITKHNGDVEDIDWKESGSSETENSVLTKKDGTVIESNKVTKKSKKVVKVTQKSVVKNTDGSVETIEIDSTENNDGSYKVEQNTVITDSNQNETLNKSETVELTSDGEYTESVTETSKDSKSNKVVKTVKKVVHKDKSETYVQEETVCDSEDKEIEKRINSVTKDTEGNVLDSRVYQLNEDGTYSDYNYKLNNDGTSTESNEKKDADGSEEKVTETKDKDNKIIIQKKYIKKADGSTSDYSYEVKDDGSTTESNEIINADGSVEKVTEIKNKDNKIIIQKKYIKKADGSISDYSYTLNDDETMTEENTIVDSEGLSTHSVVTKDKDSKVIAFEAETTHKLEELVLADVDGDILIADEYKDCVKISCDDEDIVSIEYDFENLTDEEIKYYVVDSNGFKTEVTVTFGEKGEIIEKIVPVPYLNIKVDFEDLIPCLKIVNQSSILTAYVDRIEPYVLGELTWYVDGTEKGKGEILDVSGFVPGEYIIVVTDGEAYGAFILQK